MAEGITQMFALCGLAMLISGVATMTLRDYMDVSHFHFPIHWVWMSQVGYSLLLPVHRYVIKPQDPGRLPFVHSDATAMPMKVYVSCMIMDSFAMMCAYCAMGVLSAAVVQMLRGTKLMITFFVHIYVFNKKPQRNQYLGVGCALCGLLIVIIGSMSMGHSKHHSKLGGSGHGVAPALCLCLISELFNSALYVYQEFVVKKYDAAPLQLVGTMGCLGIGVFSCLLVALNIGGIESTSKAIDKLANNGPLVIGAVVYTLCAALFDLSGVWVAKEGSAVGRAMIDVTRSACIWGCELAFHWLNFKVAHLIGFATIVTGTLIFNGIIPVPGFEPEQEEKIKKVEEEIPEAKFNPKFGRQDATKY